MRLIPMPVFLLAAAALAGCASPSGSVPVSTTSTEGTTLVQTGVVTDARDIAVRGGTHSPVGATVGALLGGIAGSSIGSGLGRTTATVAGAAAGGFAGQHIEQSNSSTSVTRLTVRLGNGDIHTYDVEPGVVFRVGDTVKVITNAGKTRVTH